ncbi:hypothetical protein L9F63_009161, partial [Diploptera punctata]
PKERVFVTVPRFKMGVPATLATVVSDRYGNPILRPYPSWEVNNSNCSGLLSVMRIKISQCGHLWVLDTGREDVLDTFKYLCPPKLRVYDLKTDEQIWEYILPDGVLTNNSLMGTVELQGNCRKPFAYLADIVGQGIVVVNTPAARSWRVENGFTQADPTASTYNIDGETFHLDDGTISLAATSTRVYFHSLSSFTENYVPVSVLTNEWNFQQPGDSVNQFHQYSGQRSGQSGPAVIANSGRVMLFSNLPENSLYCWRVDTSYEPRNFYQVFRNDVTFQFASGMKVVRDRKNREYVLAVSSRFQDQINNHVNSQQVNYRILYGAVDDLLAGKPCKAFF